MLSEDLIESYRTVFDSAVDHRLVNELCAGKLADKTLLIYLVQDVKYFNLYMKIVLKTAYLCPDEAATIRFGKQVGFISNDENDYFERTIDLLCGRDSSLERYVNDKSFVLDEVKQYLSLLTRLTTRLQDYSYDQMVTYLWTTEVVYLRWAQKALKDPNVPSDLHWRLKGSLGKP
ncbi:hypothetical protein FOA43_003043 [Brettanomyces nanus]|uniref:Thiaminase-2/PQQC domain-containing protein n=1 Tax=Eeniella nana TaxID=13502 RepID=A0A875S9E3_EENNA|nr:uncharacterized protein FOA43_003043 [Brettanomyces nanus]QPG75684.1 hypothetical protein FOA43_003043 [Brettanomyces nanus]